MAEGEIMQAQIVHVLRETAPDQWYAVDANGNIVSPVCESKEQLRIALGVICLALDMAVVEVVR